MRAPWQSSTAALEARDVRSRAPRGDHGGGLDTVARKGDTGKRYTLQCHRFALVHARGAPTKDDPVVSNGSGGALQATARACGMRQDRAVGVWLARHDPEADCLRANRSRAGRPRS